MKIPSPSKVPHLTMLCLLLACCAQRLGAADAQPVATPAPIAATAAPDPAELLKTAQPALDKMDEGHYAAGVYAIDGGRLLPLASFRDSFPANADNLKRSYLLARRPLFILSANWLTQHKADATNIFGFDWRFLDVAKTHPKIQFMTVPVPDHSDLILMTPQEELKPGLYSMQSGDLSYPDQAEFRFGVETPDEGAYWREVQHDRPQNWQAYSHLGALLWSQHDTNGALEQWKKAVELSPKLFETHNNYALALNAAGHVDEALEQCKLAVENGGDKFPAVRMNYARLLVVSKHYKEALAQYEALQKLQSNDPQALTYMGTCYFQEGKYEQALDCFQKALNIAPDYPEAKLNLEATKKKLEENAAAGKKTP